MQACVCASTVDVPHGGGWAAMPYMVLCTTTHTATYSNMHVHTGYMLVWRLRTALSGEMAAGAAAVSRSTSGNNTYVRSA